MISIEAFGIQFFIKSIEFQIIISYDYKCYKYQYIKKISLFSILSHERKQYSP